MKKIKIKNLLCFFFFSYALFSEFPLFVLFFHLGLFYWFLFTLTPLNFQKRKVNIYDVFATFCFIVVFVSLHQRQLHWGQFTSSKGEGMLFSFILFYFIIIFHLNFLHLRQLKKSSKNSAKFIQPSLN